jgi:hypothetical protein
MNINYVLKVEDAKPVAVQKALKEAGITVRSIQQVHKEGEEQEKAEAEDEKD